MSKRYPHVEWLDLNNDGTLHEVAIVKRDSYGNVHFIKLMHLDMIDKRRLAGILSHRKAENMELYELLSQITLGNGVNALSYFHQVTMLRTANGQVIKPQMGRIGSPGIINTRRNDTAAPTAKRQAPPTGAA